MEVVSKIFFSVDVGHDHLQIYSARSEYNQEYSVDENCKETVMNLTQR